MNPLPEGLLLVDKGAGATSHDMVARVRRLTGQRRTGHAGTLDPFATGLLPMMLGRATRLIRFLPSSPKVYEGALELGRTTSTDDLTGETLSRHPGELPAAAAVLEAAVRLTGPQLQVPPAVSAKKIGGQRMYRLARRGQAVEAKPAAVEVFEFRLQATDSPQTWTFRASVSPGTYIRALARDLGADLGCGGLLTALRRTAVGPLQVADAVALPARDDPGPDPDLGARVIPLDRLPLELPTVRIENRPDADLFLAGGQITMDCGREPGSEVQVTGPAGELLGVGECTGSGLQPRVVLPPP